MLRCPFIVLQIQPEQGTTMINETRKPTVLLLALFVLRLICPLDEENLASDSTRTIIIKIDQFFFRLQSYQQYIPVYIQNMSCAKKNRCSIIGLHSNTTRRHFTT